MPKLALHWQIFIAIVLAVICGSLSGTTGGVGNVSFYGLYDFVGTMFLNALRMVIVPLVMASIISGIASVGSGSDLGRLGLKTMGCYALFTGTAIFIGLLYVSVLQPGIIDGAPAGERLNLTLDSAEVENTLNNLQTSEGV